jgi:PAS domain S-box-containing protein
MYNTLTKSLYESEIKSEQLAASHDRLLALSEAALEGIALFEGGYLLDSNAPFARMFGYAPKEMKGFAVADFLDVGPDRSPGLSEFMDRARDLEGIKKGGGRFPAKVHGKLLSSQGTALRALAIHDLSDQKKLEKSKEDLAKARDTFIAVTSHELRSPISHLDLVQMLLAVVAKEVPGDMPQLDKARAALFGAARKIGEIASATQVIASLQLRTIDRILNPTPLYPLIASCVDITKVRAEEEKRNVTFSVDLSALPKNSVALVEPELFQRALLEPMSNAVKYSEEGGGVEITALLEQGVCRVVIIDGGVGMAPDHLLHVSEPFYTVADANRHHSSRYGHLGGGLGLGLSLSKLIVEVFGGGIEISSVGLEKGSSVTITMPVTQDEVAIANGH